MAKIDAIEPDATVVDSYAELPNVYLQNLRVEDVPIPSDAFDLIHLSHTLEHLDDPLSVLVSLRSALRDEGVLVCEVPNLATIDDPAIVEEFFIDKHAYHFDMFSLRTLFEHAGLGIIDAVPQPDPNNLLLLARKRTKERPMEISAERVAANRHRIAAYSRRLGFNRGFLPDVVEKKLQPLTARLNVYYWGAGRTLDALFKYGGLVPASVHGLVDRFLAGIVRDVHGIRIERPEVLRLREPHAVVVLARTAEDAIAGEAYSFGIRHVVKFTELLMQCTDAPKE